MEKNKWLRQAILIASIPSIIVFLVTVLFLKLVEVRKVSLFIAIIILLIVYVSMVGGIVKLLSGMIGCFSDVSNNIEGIGEGKVSSEIRYHVKNDATRELLERVQGMIFEFTKIIKGIKDATARLGAVVTEFKGVFHEMSEMSENINSEARIIAENVKKQANMTESFIGNIESAGASISMISTQIKELNECASNIKECNCNADEIMKELVCINEQNGVEVQNINRQTMTTNQSVQEIMEAVDIITNIAGKTNLLALNASIEAARAGEQGKGFSVVAEEIGELAIQSKNSSARIAEIVDELIHNSNESVEITKQLEEAFDKQSEKIQQTEEIFGILNKEIDHVSEVIFEIDKETDSAKKHGDTMKNQIASLKETVEKNAISVENTISEMCFFENIMGKCKDSTEMITGVSEELISYIADISEKKKQVNVERK